MPGGVNNYLKSLRWAAEQIRRAEVSPGALAAQMVDHYAVSPKYAELSIGFLARAGLLGVQSGVCTLPDVTKAWQRNNDPAPLILTLHDGVQFIGEMLALLDAPMTTSDLLHCANEHYQMGWQSTGQVGFRAAWLRSAGFVGLRDQRFLYRTDAGTAFLDLVVVEPPLGDSNARRATTAADAGPLDAIQQDTTEHQPRQVAYVSWEDRASGVLPMPGGYDGYLDSLRWLARSVQEASATRAQIAERMAKRFDLTDTSVETRVSFLQKVGFLRIESGSVVLPEFMKSWLRHGESTRVIVQLHIGAQFVGEMLKMLEEPTTTAELHRLACDQYSMGWETHTQIDNRRGWLQSAGLIRYDKRSRCLYRTDMGTDFLEAVVVEPPLGPQPPVGPLNSREIVQEEPQVPDPMPARAQARPSGAIAELVDRIIGASTASQHPTQFESVVRDAFAFLGFEAEHLGGSGKTDVLLRAPLGLRSSYVVTINAKTSASGELTEGQVNWVTELEHRDKHEADFAMLVGPNCSDGRLLERATRMSIAVLPAQALVDLCRKHWLQPLGLLDYKSLFERGGRADLSHVEQRFEAAGRLVALAKRLLDAIGRDAEYLGPRLARDLHGRLYVDTGTIVASEEEIQGLLETLASPIVRAIHGDPENGYVLSCSPTVTAERLRILGASLVNETATVT